MNTSLRQLLLICLWGGSLSMLGMALSPSLGALAAFRRRKTGISLTAITGSNGKTSTRRMTAAILDRRFRTLASRGNFNNEIGLPLTLLRLPKLER